jgi:hypothetical protein
MPIDPWDFQPSFGASPFSQTPGMQPLFDLSPIMGQGPLAQAASMGLMPIVMNWLGRLGMVPGQMFPSQNLQEQFTARRLVQQQQDAMRTAMAADQEQMRRQLAGLFRLVSPGNQLSPEQSGLVNNLAASGMRLLPYIAPFAPGLVDQLFGTRGSAGLMAMGMAQGWRLMADARGVTGMMPGSEIGAISGQVFNQLLGPGAAVAQMRGFGGASLGQMFNELSQRGLIGEPTFGGPGGPANAQAMRAMQSGHVASRLKEMVGAVSAMRDIFGDMGRPNAPMAELIAGLEALTQGGLHRLDRNRLEMLLRNTQQMANLTGVSMQAVAGMQMQAGQLADAMGVNRTLVPGIVNQSMAMATAYGQLAGATPAWNKASKEQMMLLEQRLLVGAAGSDLNNQLGAIARLGDAGLLKQGTQAFAYYQAIKRGDASGVAFMQPGAFMQMLQGSGVNQAAASSVLVQTEANAEAGARYNTTQMTRRMQRELEIAPLLEFGFQQAALRQAPGNTALAVRASRLAQETLFGMKENVLASPGLRADALVTSLKNKLTPDEQRALGGDAGLRVLANNGWADLQELFRTTPGLEMYGNSPINAISANSNAVFRRADVLTAQADARARNARALSGLNVGPLRRLMDELARSDGTNLERLAAVFAGGIDQAKLLGQLQGPLGDIGRDYARLENLNRQAEILAANDSLSPDVRNKLMQSLNRERDVLGRDMATRVHGTDMPGAVKMAEKLGVSLDELLTGESLDGRALPGNLVKEARSKAGAYATSQAMGFTPERAEIVRRQKMSELNKLAAPDREGTLRKLEEVRRRVATRAAGPGGSADKMTPEDVDRQFRAALEGGKIQDINPLGSRMIDILRSSGMSLDEAIAGIRADQKREEDRQITVTGKLELIGNNQAKIQARGAAGFGR